MELEPLQPPDSFHLQAAEGWLELGNPLEAGRELAQISPAEQEHPLVLELCWKAHAAGKDWEAAAEAACALTRQLPAHPLGWIHWAYSLHELKRTREAWEILLPVAEQFPGEYIIRYNLACYACQLGHVAECRRWLAKAMDLAGKETILAMAAADPDLQPLREQPGGFEPLSPVDGGSG